MAREKKKERLTVFRVSKILIGEKCRYTYVEYMVRIYMYM